MQLSQKIVIINIKRTPIKDATVDLSSNRHTYEKKNKRQCTRALVSRGTTVVLCLRKEEDWTITQKQNQKHNTYCFESRRWRKLNTCTQDNPSEDQQVTHNRTDIRQELKRKKRQKGIDTENEMGKDEARQTHFLVILQPLRVDDNNRITRTSTRRPMTSPSTEFIATPSTIEST